MLETSLDFDLVSKYLVMLDLPSPEETPLIEDRCTPEAACKNVHNFPLLFLV